MRSFVSLLVVALLAGCSTPSSEVPALPRTQTFALSVGDGGSVSQNFEVEAGATRVTVDVAPVAAVEGWTATLRAPSGSEAMCQRPADSEGADSEPCGLEMPAQAGTWTLSFASSGANRAEATVTIT